MKQITFALILGASVGILDVNAVAAPDSIGLRFTRQMTSLSGKKEKWAYNVKPNRLFQWSGLYLGDAGKYGCTDKGGSVKKFIRKSKQEEIVTLARKTLTEGQSNQDENFKERSDNKLDQLFVEWGKEFKHANLSQASSQGSELRKALDNAVAEIIGSGEGKILSIKTEVSKDNKKFIVKISNEGKKEKINFSLPDKAEKFFRFQTDSEFFPLSYFKKSSNSSSTVIAPGKSVSVELKRDEKIHQQGVVVLDTADLYQSKVKTSIKVNAPMLRICGGEL